VVGQLLMTYNVDEVKMASSTGVANARVNPPQPTPVYEDEVIDWDCSFDDPPPPRDSGRIEAVVRRAKVEPSPV
jgi:hypothetical protein